MGAVHWNLKFHPLPHACFRGLTFFQAKSHWLSAIKYSLDLFERSLYKQRLSHSPLQKRETERENGCFPLSLFENQLNLEPSPRIEVFRDGKWQNDSSSKNVT